MAMVIDAVQLPLFTAESDGPDVQYETFQEAREIIEGLQCSYDVDEEQQRDFAVLWCLIEDCCKLIHGQGVEYGVR